MSTITGTIKANETISGEMSTDSKYATRGVIIEDDNVFVQDGDKQTKIAKQEDVDKKVDKTYKTVYGRNRFNHKTCTLERAIDEATGELVESATQAVTDYIDVSTGNELRIISLYGMEKYVEYDEYKNLLAIHKIETPYTKKTYKLSKECKYIRAEYNDWNDYTQYFINLDEWHTLEKYTETVVEDVVLTESDIDSTLSKAGKPADAKVVGDTKLSVIHGDNLFDKDAVKKGFRLYYDNNEIEWIEEPNEEWFISDYIKVEPLTEYCINNLYDTHLGKVWVDERTPENGMLCYYGCSHNPEVNMGAFAFTTSNTTQYIRFSAKVSDLNTAMMKESYYVVDTPHEPYYKYHKPIEEKIYNVKKGYMTKNNEEIRLVFNSDGTVTWTAV